MLEPFLNNEIRTLSPTEGAETSRNRSRLKRLERLEPTPRSINWDNPARPRTAPLKESDDLTGQREWIVSLELPGGKTK
jgi:hypothetical protein